MEHIGNYCLSLIVAIVIIFDLQIKLVTYLDTCGMFTYSFCGNAYTNQSKLKGLFFKKLECVLVMLAAQHNRAIQKIWNGKIHIKLKNIVV